MASECDIWFKRAKIKETGAKCLLKCATVGTDLGAFNCPNECDRLCGIKSGQETNASLNQFAYYFGLTADELALVAKYPNESLTVYKQKEIAQSVVAKHFRVDRPDSESDAIRHFVWAALISKELGPEMAKQYLDAHEAGLPASDPGRAMDLANNQSGILAAEALKKQGKCTEETIEKEGIHLLKSGKLVVLKPGNPSRGGTK